jgi:repressor LexA
MSVAVSAIFTRSRVHARVVAEHTNSPKVNVSRPDYKKSFPDRFKRARKLSGLTLKQLAPRVGVSFQTIQRWETGERTPERIAAQKAAEVLQDSFGEPWLTSYATKQQRDVPVEARVAAGRPIEYYEAGDETITIDPNFIRSAGDLTALRVSGDSMVEDHILNGDILICRKTPEPRKSSIVVVDFKGQRGASVKHWERKGDVIYLSSDPDLPISEKQAFQTWEVGKVFEVVGLIRSLR